MDTDVYRLIGLSCALFFSCSVCSTIPPNDTPPPFCHSHSSRYCSTKSAKYASFVCSQHLLFFFFCTCSEEGTTRWSNQKCASQKHSSGDTGTCTHLGHHLFENMNHVWTKWRRLVNVWNSHAKVYKHSLPLTSACPTTFLPSWVRTRCRGSYCGPPYFINAGTKAWRW